MCGFCTLSKTLYTLKNDVKELFFYAERRKTKVESLFLLRAMGRLPPFTLLNARRSMLHSEQNRLRDGRREVVANVKTPVLSAAYVDRCTSVWFCKDPNTANLALTVCPVLSMSCEL